jgi:hypothetical protein
MVICMAMAQSSPVYKNSMQENMRHLSRGSVQNLPGDIMVVILYGIVL